MWKLTIEDDEGTKTLLPLVRDEYHIGREEKNTIRLTERNISRNHASLKKEGAAGWNIVDHESYNGCYVNGQRVAGNLKLSHSDIIQLGDYRIFITSDVAEAEAASSATITAPVPAQVPAQEKTDRFVVVAGPDIGREYPLGTAPFTIGRAEECNISINHPSVSRVHAEIKALGNGRYEITDKGSSNGVRVNGIDFRRTLLENGDGVELGDVRLRFVERGQHYIPHANMTMQLTAMSARQSELATPTKEPEASASKPKTGMILGGVAVVAVLLGVAAIAMGSKGDDNPKPQPVVTEDKEQARDIGKLETAKKAANAGDYPGSAAALAEIPETSVVRQNPDYNALWMRWADWMIGEAAKTSDLDSKRKTLSKVAENTAVDASRRKTASDILSLLTVPGADINQLPGAGGQGGVAIAPPDPGTDPGTKPANTSTKKDPSAPATAATTAATSTTSSPEDTETKQRRALEARMNSGKANKDDLRMLKALCQHQGDMACKNKANEAIKKLAQ
jgi:pSer/pThr/pTyr-binding forkhead associated (FHA) protein